MVDTQSVTQTISTLLGNAGFANFGFAELKRPQWIEYYQLWLQEGCHGDMAYLQKHLPQKLSPETWQPQLKNAIVLTKDYVTHPYQTKMPISPKILARYARGSDYHVSLQFELDQICEQLRARFPNSTFLPFVDTAPIMERELATRAGLGWIGKNTCLIGRKTGSLFWLAQILTNLSIPGAQIQYHDFCGTCTRCIDACPTQAITAPRRLDSRLCLSYWTIEAKQSPSPHLAEKFATWLFGCDICQTVCPWNIKVHGPELQEGQPTIQEIENDVLWLLSSSNRELIRAFRGTPLLRRGTNGIRRNAIVLAANQKVINATPFLQKFLDQPKLKQIAEWALAKLSESDKMAQKDRTC